MGLMDKVKAQASQLGQKAQEAAQEGKARLDQAQAQRSGGTMLRQLGALVYADRTGRGTPDTQTKIDSLISEISTFEQTNGLNLTSDQSQSTVPPQGAPPQGSPPGQSGSFTGGEDTGTTTFAPGPFTGPDEGTGPQ
jgi:hypothetical protein